MLDKKACPILVVGSLNMDLVVNTERLPKAGETIFGKSFATFPGGKGGNQAVAVGKLGGKVAMAGCVGNDAFGKQLIAGLAENKVDTDGIRVVDTATGTALITVEETGMNTIVVVAGANADCDIADIDRALARFSVPGILILQHEIPAETVEYAIKKAKAKGWTIILNPAPVRSIPEEVLALVDILTPNESEASVLADLAVVSIETAICAGEKLLAKGVKEVVITLGGSGAVWVHKAGHKRIEAYQVKAVDTTAAGDSYTGAMAVALAEGYDMPASLDFAARTAAIAVTRPGAQTAIPTRAEVEAFDGSEGGHKE